MERNRIITERIREITHCSIMESQQFVELFQPLCLNQRDHLVLGDTESRSLYFLDRGLIHHFQQPSTVIPNQSYPFVTSIKKCTLVVYQSAEFFFPGSHLTNPSTTHILEALSPCQLLIATDSDIEALIQKHPKIHQLYVALHQHYLHRTLQHLQLLQTNNAAKRYELISQQFGKHLYLIPKQYQAAYIGISRKHLGRIIRANLKRKTL